MHKNSATWESATRPIVRPKLFGITQSAFDPASRFRFIQFIPYLHKAGWNIEHRPNRPDRQWYSPLKGRLARAIHYRAGRLVMRFNRVRDFVDARSYDVIFVNRDFSGEGAVVEKMFKPLVQKSVFDFDDAIFVGRHEKNVRWMCEKSCWVTPGNEYLACYARQFTDRVTVIPTVIDTERVTSRSYEGLDADKSMVRVGWSGSDQSISSTLFPHLEMLKKLQDKVGFELVVIANTRPELPVGGLRWSFRPWKQAEEAQMGEFFDIGIMPLVDDDFQKGKCALKLLQYMAAGLPNVASPVGVNKEVVEQGVTGMLATSDAEWHQALECLIQNKQMRASMGLASRKRCEDGYSVRRWLPVLLGILETVRNEQAQHHE